MIPVIASVAKRSLEVCVVATLLAMTASSAHAHHSFAMFDRDNPIVLEGTIERVEWTNPHTWIFLRVLNDDGSEAVWGLEYGPVNMLSRRGLTEDTLKPGDAFKVRVNPIRSGENVAQLIGDSILVGPEVTPLPWRKVVRAEPVEMSDEVARDFNGIWFGADGANRFDTSVPQDEVAPPLTPEYQARWDERKRKAAQGIAIADPTAACVSGGFPRILGMVFPSEILQAEHQLNWYVEWNEDTFRIYLDGRERPKDLFPTFMGFTTGEWEGNTLVTHTTHLRGDKLIDTTGIPHSDQLEVRMRLTKVTPDFFEAEVTLHDPIALTEPWTATKHYRRAPEGFFIQEYDCASGNRHRVDESGAVTIDID